MSHLMACKCLFTACLSHYIHCTLPTISDEDAVASSLNLGTEVQVAKDIFQRDSDAVAGEDMTEQQRAFRARTG